MVTKDTKGYFKSSSSVQAITYSKFGSKVTQEYNKKTKDIEKNNLLLRFIPKTHILNVFRSQTF